MANCELYELVSKKDVAAGSFSPCVWTTKLDLAYLGVEYDIRPYSFVQIRNDLARATGIPDVLVPTIRADGRYITDSWTIAEHLEEVYGTPEKSLFGHSATVKSYARFINAWIETNVVSAIKDFIYPKIYECLDEPSAHYFRHTKMGSDHLDDLIAKLSDENHMQAKFLAARQALAPVEMSLRERKEEGGAIWIAGEVSHADFLLFGMYAWSRMNSRLVKEVWENPKMIMIREWLDAMMNSGLVKEDLPYYKD